MLFIISGIQTFFFNVNFYVCVIFVQNIQSQLKNSNMKLRNICSLALFLSFSSISFAQVGINTPNPQGAYTIDAAKDNPPTGAPSAAQAANDITVTSTGNMGIGLTVPTNKLHISGTNPVRLQGLTAAASGDNILATDGTGVLKSLGSLESLAIPAPAVLVLRTAQTNFLQSAGGGGTQRLPLQVGRNNIPGLLYDETTSTVTFPNGVYQITFVYEATHNATSCTLSSYFMDFPGIHARRIHSTAAHNQGGSSNHGGSITFSALFDGTSSNTWVINMGRGVSGNCTGAGMTLTDYATQVLIFKLGN